MTTTIDAIYESGFLRPLEPLELAEGTRVAVTIRDNVLQTRTDAAYLLTLPRAQRRRILAVAAEAAAPLYETDLALPVAERELTAFTALDGEPFLDEEPEENAHAG